jgi:DNA-directed RNA polymerase specialized sigma24 family protein
MTPTLTPTLTNQPILARHTEPLPGMLDLEALARRCQLESRRFYSQQPYEPAYAYELFRRALVEHDQGAWEHIFAQYRPLVEHWVRRTGAFTLCGESSEYFVSAAFARFWRAIPAERFRSFPTLAALLNYLRRCASCVVIDSARAHAASDYLPEEAINWNDQRLAHADEEATDRVSRSEFWHLVDELLNTEAERVIVRSSFLLGMKPGDIYNERRDLFQGVGEVYALKRNILSRLRRSKELQGMY